MAKNIKISDIVACLGPYERMDIFVKGFESDATYTLVNDDNYCKIAEKNVHKLNVDSKCNRLYFELYDKNELVKELLQESFNIVDVLNKMPLLSRISIKKKSTGKVFKIFKSSIKCNDDFIPVYLEKVGSLTDFPFIVPYSIEEMKLRYGNSDNFEVVDP